jgi:hypothetical protein
VYPAWSSAPREDSRSSVQNEAIENNSIFCDITRCNPLKIIRRFRKHFASTFGVHEYVEQETNAKAAGKMVFCLATLSTLKIEVIRSSETSVAFQRASWLYIIF